MPFVVRTSAIHGKGAFATRHIDAGSRVGEYTGERITCEESARRLEADEFSDHPTTYRFFLDASWMIDGSVGGNDTRFINHSCDPNCRSSVRDGRIYIDASRDIGEGEEILLDYKLSCQEEIPEEFRSQFACYCGAAACRGTMLIADKA